MTDRFTDMANRVRWDLMSRPPSDAVAIIEQALRQAHKRGVQEAADAKLQAIGSLLSDNGCDCDCDHGYEDHDDDCTLCLACRIGEVLAETRHV